jgi:tRNA 2-thiouridine synthesizing protein A
MHHLSILSDGTSHSSRCNQGIRDSAMTEKTINLRALKCPLPALRAKKALTGMASGDLLTIECTDPLTAIDIPNLLRQTGDRLEANSSADGVLTFRIRKA